MALNETVEETLPCPVGMVTTDGTAEGQETTGITLSCFGAKDPIVHIGTIVGYDGADPLMGCYYRECDSHGCIIKRSKL